MNAMGEGRLLEEAAAALQSDGVLLSVRDRATDEDRLVSVTYQNTTVHLGCEIKSQLRPSTLGFLDPRGRGRLVVTSFVSTKMGRLLREAGFNYADVAGNISIIAPHLKILIDGRRPPKPTRSESSTTSLFTPAAMRVLLTLLNEQKLITAPVREVQARAGVSLGATHRVLTLLRNTGIDAPLSPQSTPSERERWRGLFEGWVGNYVARTRNAQMIDRFTSDYSRKDLLGRMKTLPMSASGEAAAFLMGEDILPSTFDWYVDDTPRNLIRQARLRSAPDGNIFVRQALWLSSGFNEEAVPRRAPMPVVYADLKALADPRADVVARRWQKHDPHIRPYFE